jgi:hypothetical protein
MIKPGTPIAMEMIPSLPIPEFPVREHTVLVDEEVAVRTVLVNEVPLSVVDVAVASEPFVEKPRNLLRRGGTDSGN